MEKYPIEPRVVQITAADYNPALHGTEEGAWDSCPFSDTPQWLRRVIECGLVVPTTVNGTDYAEWYVGPDKILATVGDWIALEKDGSVRVIKADEPNPHVISRDEAGLGGGAYFEA